MSFYNTLKSKFTGKPSGSAFALIATADDKVLQAKGRVIAIDAANREKQSQSDSLDQEVSRVHAETNAVHSRLDGILDRL